MLIPINEHCEALVRQFFSIPDERKGLLQKLSSYIQEKKAANEPIQLMYVCTHNSRRSHFGQIWSKVAAIYFGIEKVETFSGGTEATAFHPNAISALEKTGFKIGKTDSSNNPVYQVYFSENDFVTCFSKVYDDLSNPSRNFAAIMTCSDAEENCPYIAGAEMRIATTYEDPKKYDTTPNQDAAYLERSNQIALECLYVFSLVK